ncbi:helix-turn-helix transcriptional regulator [Anaerofustis butyriciformans]|uniref:helix-turn-helix domain-containing protein n=1 Tax=Anaerofustis butyriciformans TaxID=3108533 RepID=UPI002E359E81|nr:helix-turn-helix transcriptional regulator [Anaerofustis sp. HA2171]
MEIKEKITFKDFLHKRSISGYKLSKITGIPKSTVDSWLQGMPIYKARVSNILKISKALNISLSELINELYAIK